VLDQDLQLCRSVLDASCYNEPNHSMAVRTTTVTALALLMLSTQDRLAFWRQVNAALLLLLH
jgi:hypothetical protein